MRNLSPAVRSLLDNMPQGLEPITIVGIKWDANVHFYADRLVENGDQGSIAGRIVSFDQLEAITRIDMNGQSASISFVLDDTPGDIKNFMDNTNIHYTPVVVYQYFAGMDYNDMVLLFEGRLVSPIIWDESARTIQLTAVTKQVSNLIGYALDESNSGVYHQDLISKAWPVCFGKPVHVPALRLQEIPVGTTTIAFGVPDPSIKYQNQQLGMQKDKMPNVRPGTYTTYYDNGQEAIQDQNNDGYDDFLGISSSGSWGNIGVTVTTIRYEDTPQAKIGNEINKLGAVYQEQLKWFKKKNMVIGGYKFPQNRRITVKIGEQLFKAIFKGEGTPPYPDAPCPVLLEPFYDQSPFRQVYRDQLTNGYMRIPVPKEGFTFFQAGSRVEMLDALPGGYNYVASITPGRVTAVYAVRSYNGLRQLTPVPTNLYSIQTINLTPGPNSNRKPLVATVVNLPRPLSTVSYYYNNRSQNIEDYLTYTNYTVTVKYPEASQLTGGLGSHIINNQDWEDDLYVTFESDIGPNAVDVMIWLIQNYTPYDVDQTTFAHVHSRLANFPVNFAMTDRVAVDKLLADIAFQCCCALWLKGGKYYIKYLRESFDPISTIEPPHVEQNTLRVTTTETEELVTRYVVSWRSDYYTPPKRSVYTRNVDHYGVHSEDADFYVFNDFNIINKMATYWLIIKSNVWKRVTCNVVMSKLEIETLDDVRLQLYLPFVTSSEYVDCRVESASYDSASNSISLSLWTPILLGTMEPYAFATPADLSVTTVTPYFEPISGGGAGGFSMGKTMNPSSTPKYNASQPSGGGGGDPFAGSDWISGFLRHFDRGGSLPFNTDPFMTDEIIAGEAASEYVTSQQTGTPSLQYSSIPYWNYEYGMYIGEDNNPTRVNPNNVDVRPRVGAFPGQIIDGGPGTYQAVIYVRGMGGQPIVAAVHDINTEEKDTSKVLGKYYLISAVFTSDNPDLPGGTITRYFDSAKGSPAGILWARITGGSGTTHEGAVFTNGPEGPAENEGQSVTIDTPFVNPEDSLPEGTWICPVTKYTIGTGPDAETKYYYNPQTWLGGSDTE